jgi:hypothetical protein
VKCSLLLSFDTYSLIPLYHILNYLVLFAFFIDLCFFNVMVNLKKILYLRYEKEVKFS